MGSCVRFKIAPGIFFHIRLYSGGRFKTAPGIFFHTRLYSGGRFKTAPGIYVSIHIITPEVGLPRSELLCGASLILNV